MELAEDYSCILNAISQYSDIDFTIYKTNTIYRRIERRIALNNFHGVEEYLDYLLSTEEERAQLHRDLLIGVTSFFRDEEAFRHLGENVVIPLLKKRSPSACGVSHVLPVKKYIPWQYCSANVWNTCILLRM